MSEEQTEATFREKLQSARKRAGLSQEFVAKKLGVSRPTMTAIEKGPRKVTAEELATLSNLYHVSTNWLLSRESEAASKIDVAARRLAKLKPQDFKTVMDVLESLSDPDSDKK